MRRGVPRRLRRSPERAQMLPAPGTPRKPCVWYATGMPTYMCSVSRAAWGPHIAPECYGIPAPQTVFAIPPPPLPALDEALRNIFGTREAAEVESFPEEERLP